MSYDAAELKALAAKGETFDAAIGGLSYPVANAADLARAIDAVGRGNSSHDAIRKYLIGRAKALGLSSKIPSDWSADGSISDTDAVGRSGLEIAGTMFRSLGLDVELRGSGDDGRTLAGILVPYSAPQRVSAPGWQGVEEFVPGAFADQARTMTPGRLAGGLVPLCRDHEPLGGVRIGKVVNLREDAAGLYGEARVSNTSVGNDTLALLNDGILREWSVGFKPLQNRWAGPVTQRVKAHLTELAIVAHGAYGSAAGVSAIRSAINCPQCGSFMGDPANDPADAPGVEADNMIEPANAISNAAKAAQMVAQLPLYP